MFFRSRDKRSTLSLALQGGGAHGAFTWGVLDALLEDGRLDFTGISGTSAGAMNATMLAHGLLQGGRDGAREALASFWQAVASSAPLLNAGANIRSGHPATGLKLMLYWAQMLSPRQLNPLNVNPLRDILASLVDFERLRTDCPLKLFIAATNANTGRLRLFRSHELSVDCVLASACLPTFHHTVEIDGEPYWDGAFSANPAVFPLVYECDASDILLVLLSPMSHGKTPRSAEEIRRRAQELAFKSTFLREMHSLAQARTHAARTVLPLNRLERRLTRTHLHMIADDALMSRLAAESKMTTSQPFLEMLRDQGRSRAHDWLESHYRAIGRRSSVDIATVFL
ncbi:FabD/lysophospholipase-like protein [Azotobacter vinelandii CA]|uniref:FabD/lysophospholipase-like protein n=2 Tax=Azotobacter vinelandii TaxID=354 RepID=C1DSE3_AZOVD|nr:patatin-like phospholipase family protein [Azotobacter vinelandii]ACO77898.1 FabD/lysophospholipase-like protein [Azotobacter vinelandii DJ]AGK16947.1 FabD/lysophospholipase-like protein [Azotobacter vinelandii CA]AGK20062.1 FabD/lysophospholipase-like protein [Azotobacter vinelandii CA6]SFY29954.1 NTE family protein [Azotobacter vinelandii]GLK61344.1 alpha/beta hydrolase [Azotobacter vinelandii]